MMAGMPSEKPAQDRPTVMSLEWDSEAGAGYLAFGAIGAGEAVHQQVVKNPVPDVDDIVLDFDERGRLLGVEFLDERALPPDLAAS
ncbi:DUF2283 domain-containing protein [Geodermatophilus maliterrae]|uniref:DUF2283 domain-containing protein n=1 Tax=Geodermatophilus maliterrae TaxID=3162531 RepID=A0ABV3XIT7_9ACTN